MLSRLVSRTSSRIRAFPIAVIPKAQLNPKHTTPRSILLLVRPFSSNNDGNNSGGNVPPSNPWKILNDTEASSSFDRNFVDGGDAGAVDGKVEEDSWLKGEEEVGDDVFKGIERAEASGGGGGGGGGNGNEWLTAEGYKAWTLGTEEEVKDVFDIGDNGGGGVVRGGIVGLENEEARLKEREKEAEERRRLEAEEKQLTDVLKGSRDIKIRGVIEFGRTLVLCSN